MILVIWAIASVLGVVCARCPRMWVYEPVHHLALLHRHAHVVDAVVLQLSDAIRILMADVAAKEVIHGSAMQTLSLRDRTFLVGEEQGLEVDDFLTELSDSG
jgi:hypothetical protein